MDEGNNLQVSGFRNLLQWLLPNHCVLCDVAAPGFVCPACDRDLPTADYACYGCAIPLSAAEALGSPGVRFCGDCLHQPKPFGRVLAAYVYQHPVDYLINRFKHHRHFASGDYLSKRLSDAAARAYSLATPPDALVPVPLHWSRRWRRGFNQSEMIAGQLSTHLSLPIVNCCRRRRRNPRQQGLKRRERLGNLRRAFSVKADVRGKHLVLVDDVMTTGATATELTRTLLAAGAARVDVWVLARVP